MRAQTHRIAEVARSCEAGASGRGLRPAAEHREPKARIATAPLTAFANQVARCARNLRF